MQEYNVYAHIDPKTSVPFYIGIGKGRRAYSKQRGEYWVKFTSSYIESYEVQIIAEKVDQENAWLIENLFVSKFGRIHNGKGVLLNWTGGGYGEGTYILVGFGDENEGIEELLTDYGKRLLGLDVTKMDVSVQNGFIKDVINERIIYSRDKCIKEISKSSTPRKSWIVPFCLSKSLNKDDTFKIEIPSKNDLISVFSKPFKIEELHELQYVDTYIHRVAIFFDLLLQENVSLLVGNEKISRSCIEWYFYSEYWNGFMKIVKAKNKGHQLSIKYCGQNNRNHNREDIHEFEFNVL